MLMWLFILVTFCCSWGFAVDSSDNGGTLLAIAGKGFCLVASDTRLSSNYAISTRHISRLVPVQFHIFK
jgi:20S proteasome alpha/beta subunit